MKTVNQRNYFLKRVPKKYPNTLEETLMWNFWFNTESTIILYMEKT